MRAHVLITGAAGNQANFIWKALMQSGLDVRVIGCNYNHNGVGLFRFDVGYVVPAAKEPTYVPSIIELCKRERIQIIMVGNMVEMRILAQHRDMIKQECGAFVVTSPYEVLTMMEDKWEFSRFLCNRGFDFPLSALTSDSSGLAQLLDDTPFPYVVKHRLGLGSKGVMVVRNKSQLAYALETMPDSVVQEYLFPDDEEYTVGVFMLANGKPAGSIVMKRQIDLGMTWKAQVLPNSELGLYCERILEDSGVIGPCNVQLRLTKRGPVVFEVNPRFSATTASRVHFGYNDPAMCIKHFVHNEEIPRPRIRPGRLFRVIDDICISEERFDFLNKVGRIENNCDDLGKE